ncbi:MAG: hypothetical protein QOC82_1161 [Frankiaceae bacterium]|nr:hypothetical protein [Frankiaceae bacterium]
MLEWREGKPDDKPLLSQFSCARQQRAGQRRIFPFPWEKQVQSAVRTVKPTCDAQSAILLGAHPDTGAILGVVSVAKLDLAEDGYIIEMIAVENSARSQRIGDEAMNEALQWIANHADVRGIRTVTVVADCHRRNKRARALLRRNKFLSAGVEGVREEWFYEFSLR